MKSQFDDYIRNKSVAVVGPAYYVTMFDNKEYIESFDIVMRFNDILPIHRDMIKHIGSRTDILCNGLDGSPNSCGKYNSSLWKNSGVEWVFCPYTVESRNQSKFVKMFKRHNNNLLKFYASDFESFNKVSKSMKTFPNSGLLGLMYLINNNVGNVFLTGFSFGKGGYSHHKGYKDHLLNRDRSSGIHNQAEQLEYFKKQYKIYKNIEVDSYLKKILEGEV